MKLWKANNLNDLTHSASHLTIIVTHEIFPLQAFEHVVVERWIHVLRGFSYEYVLTDGFPCTA